MAEHKYHLRISAGPSYDESKHSLIPVNTGHPTSITSSHISAFLSVRIQNYRGLPKDSPETSPYFSHAPHTADLYSLAFSFALTADITGDALLFGNDFAHPIRDSLPPGFNTALRIVKWTVDPGLQGDVYADEPYMYGPLLSSINVLHVGDKHDGGGGPGKKDHKQGDEEEVPLAEGGTESGMEEREKHGVPEDGPKRMKFFLDEHKRKEWTFEKGREYRCDFFNPYLDFNELAVKLPGFNLGLLKYWDGQPLRYVLKHKDIAKGIDEVLLVIIFTLIQDDEIETEEKKWAKIHGSADEKPTPGSETKKESAAPAKDDTSGNFIDDDID